MHILIAPDKFKGSLTAREVCVALDEAIREFDPTIATSLVPLSDGGDGSLEVLSSYLKGTTITTQVRDPLGRSIESQYLLTETAAYIEMASASGLVLLNDEERNPLFTSSFGTGEMILDAITRGAKEIYLFVGGSATNDMGIGMAQALGYQFMDKDNQEVPPVGLSMPFIMEIKKKLVYDPKEVSFYAVCDVQNQLYGEEGAAHVYAAQKGADEEAILLLDKGLRKLSRRCAQFLDRNFAHIRGSGAAGGIGAGVIAFLDGELMSGVDFMIQLTKLEEEIKRADIVITGEGRIDPQTLYGKTISGVASLTSKYNKPLWVIAGEALLGQEDIDDLAIQKILSILDLTSNRDDAIQNARKYLQQIIKENLDHEMRL